MDIYRQSGLSVFYCFTVFDGVDELYKHDTAFSDSDIGLDTDNPLDLVENLIERQGWEYLREDDTLTVSVPMGFAVANPQEIAEPESDSLNLEELLPELAESLWHLHLEWHDRAGVLAMTLKGFAPDHDLDDATLARVLASLNARLLMGHFASLPSVKNVAYHVSQLYCDGTRPSPQHVMRLFEHVVQACGLYWQTIMILENQEASTEIMHLALVEAQGTA